MCKECGCQEGLEARQAERAGAHRHVDAQGRTYVHVHEDEGAGEDGHVHVHVHVHVHHEQEHEHTHEHEHEHTHTHTHEHDHSHDQVPDRTARRIEVERRVLQRNDEAAERNRAWMRERGLVAVNLISSPGSGKTLLLQKTLDALRGRVECAVIVGDQETDRDARRLTGHGAPVRQIQTRASCHLDAEQVGEHLRAVVGPTTRLLFIENVGNLVCPAAFDLGEQFKIALLSPPEGEDKPLKYPVLFHDAPVTVITKLDLVPHLEWSRTACLDAIRAVRPDARILEVSARTGEGMSDWIAFLEGLVRAAEQKRPSVPAKD
ncbi:MAG: hydrogenase nickel incorporation protein HypB [Deltaproteobacteria bacterium]|nr:hydrogenase nickel incorporation protein HypB [Deltaproteobacteria bacterium]